MYLIIVAKKVLILAVVGSLVLEDHVPVARFAPGLSGGRKSEGCDNDGDGDGGDDGDNL